MPASHLQRAAALGLVAAAALLLGLVQEILLARRFGTGSSADAFAAAILLPTVVMTVLGNAASGAFLACHADQPDRGAAFQRSVLAVGVAGAVLLALFAHAWAGLVYAGFSGPLRAQTAELLRPLAALAATGALFALLKARYNARGQFAAPAAAGLLVPASASASLALGAGISAVALTVVGAWIAQLLLLQRAGPWRGRGSSRDEWSLAAPLIAVSALGLAYQPLGRAIASHLVEGGVAALRYADNVLQLPVALLYLPLSTVVLPALAAHLLRGERAAFQRLFAGAWRWLLRIGLLGAVILGALGRIAAAALYEGGAFRPDSTVLVGKLLSAAALAALPLAHSSLTVPTWIALRRTRTLLRLGALFFGANLVLLALLVPRLGIVGVALAGALAACLSEAAALRLLLRERQVVLDRLDWQQALRAVIAALAVLAVLRLAFVPLAATGGPRPVLLLGAALGALAFGLIAVPPAERRLLLDQLRNRPR